MDWDERIEARQRRREARWEDQLIESKENGRLQQFLRGLRGGMPCEVASVPEWMRGCFNICIAVVYEDGVKWLARFCSEGWVRHADEKVRREVATMDFVSQNTTIPVPRVHAWGLASDNPLSIGAFIVMDFIEGVRLADLWMSEPDEHDLRWLRKDVPEEDLRTIYRQCAAYLLELDTHPFQFIGSLAYEDQSRRSILVSPFTIKMHEIEAHTDVWVGGKRDMVFKSVSKYFRYVLDQNWGQLECQINSIDNAEDAKAKFIHLKGITAALPEFSGPYDNVSQFRLFSDDFGYHNIIVKSPTDLTIVSVIDWEWTYAAPYQMFTSPPRWLALSRPWAFNESEVDAYSRLLELFLDELRQQEDVYHGADTPRAIKNVDPIGNHMRRLNLENLEPNGHLIEAKDRPQIKDDVTENGTSGLSIVKPNDTMSGTLIGLRPVKMPPPPDARGQRLSVLMKENWDSGRFWFHDIIQIRDLSTDYWPWERLLEKYPYLKDLSTVDEENLEEFVKMKLEQREHYDRDLAQLKAAHPTWFGQDEEEWEAKQDDRVKNENSTDAVGPENDDRR